jgi:hypothetical protein
MKHLWKFVLACVPVALIAACGGGDTEDRLDVADPAVRFVHASALAPNLTLNRANVPLAQATNVPYKFASDYVDIDTAAADWQVKTADAAALTIGTVTINPQRGTKYTVVAVPAVTTGSSTYLIVDPYNKPLGSESTRLRLMNATPAAVDLYMNAPGTDITPATVTPFVAGTAARTSGPASGSDSLDIRDGTYQATVTTAGTKTVLFRGTVAFDANKDLLLIAVPDATTGVKLLMKIQGTAGATDVPAV